MEVDVAWVESSYERVNEGSSMLADWSKGRGLGIKQVVKLPESLAKAVIDTVPSAILTQNDYENALEQDQDEARLRIKIKNRIPTLCIPHDLVWQEGPFVAECEGQPRVEPIVGVAEFAGLY